MVYNSCEIVPMTTVYSTLIRSKITGLKSTRKIEYDVKGVMIFIVAHGEGLVD